MEIPYFTTRQELSKFLKLNYLSKDNWVQITRLFNLAFFDNVHRASKVPTHNTDLRIIDTGQYEPSDSLIKMLKVVGLVRLSEKLYRELEKELKIEVQYHFQSVNGFCRRLAIRRKKSILLTARPNKLGVKAAR